MTPLQHPVDHRPRRSRITAGLLGATLTLGALSACSTGSGTGTGTTSTGTWGDSSVRSASDSEGTVWDPSTVHTISVDVDEAAYAAMLETFVSTDEKEWISATVTIDDQAFTNVGLRLKGNSSLKSTSTTDSEAQDLPWLIRLDKFVDGQALDGSTDFVVRSSSTQTALNEAVALDLFERAGLATQQAIATRFSVNGSAEILRLTIENPDDTWDAAEFGTDGILYKAEAGGDYSYRGDDPEAYTDVFDQETGEDDLEPLTDLLQFINDSDDETFAAELSDHLDVDAFATYLAMQELVDNFDDIDGPGNNSYLRYDTATGAFTVVSWDLNLAFGQTPMGGGEGGAMGGGGPDGAQGERPTLPDGAELPEGASPPEGVEPGEGFPGGDRPTDLPTDLGDRAGGTGGPGGAMGGSNILSSRFLENADFTALYEKALADLAASLYTSGEAEEVLDTWVAVLTDQASDLVDATTLGTEADAVRTVFSSTEPSESSGSTES